MSEMGLETTIVASVIALWFMHGWYLNTRLQHVHKKLDSILEQFDGLRRYLYEIDPQFDNERELLGELMESVSEGTVSFGGMNLMELRKQKEKQGRRTLDSPWIS
jgi:hypothetical protein